MPFKKGYSGNIKGRPRLTEKERVEKEKFKSLLKESTRLALESIINIASDRRNKDCFNASRFIIEKAYGTGILLFDEESTEVTINIIRSDTEVDRSYNDDTDWD